MIPKSPSGLDSDDPILRAFAGPLPEVRVSVLYRRAVSLVALAMVLLPLAYVGLIIAGCYGLYWHATTNRHLLTDSGWVYYLAPLVMGSILLLFMIKPLFAPRDKEMTPLHLTPEQEPRLHAFVNRLCEVVGAPRPRQIVVDCEANASAGFRRGLISVLGNDLVLTIGLPLVGGLTLNGLAGVLAHEFGHFGQKTGLRVTYVIRSVNLWFARVVWSRDAWDVMLQGLSQAGFPFMLLGWIAQFFVFLTRGVLWGLMMAGQVLSCFLMRQMELDADRYEAHLVGSRGFAENAGRLPFLVVGVQAAQADLEHSLTEDRLVDDFVALALENEANLPVALREEVRRFVEEETTGLLDTHPCTTDRVANAELLDAPGLFDCTEPATALFADFATLSRAATRDLYAAVLGDEASRHELVPFGEYVADRNSMLNEVETLRRYFQDVVHPLHPLRIPLGEPGGEGDPVALERELRANREELLRGLDWYRSQFNVFDGLDDRRLQLRIARALLEGRITFEPEVFELPVSSLHAVHAAQGELDVQVGNLLRNMAPPEEMAARRFWAAISLARSGVGAPVVDGDAAAGRLAQRAELDRLLPTLRLLSPLMPQLVILRDEFQALLAQHEMLEGGEQHESLYRAMVHSAEYLRGLVHGFGAQLGETPYSLEHDGPPVPIWKYLLGDPPEGDEFVQALVPAQNAVDRGYRLYSRVLGGLSIVAERVESALGLELLEDPPDPPEDDEDDE